MSAMERNMAIDRATVLRNINSLRAIHGVPPLLWSEICARRASQRANQEIGAINDFGESLARSADERWHDPTTACVQSVKHWQVDALLLCHVSSFPHHLFHSAGPSVSVFGVAWCFFGCLKRLEN